MQVPAGGDTEPLPGDKRPACRCAGHTVHLKHVGEESVSEHWVSHLWPGSICVALSDYQGPSGVEPCGLLYLYVCASREEL